MHAQHAAYLHAHYSHILFVFCFQLSVRHRAISEHRIVSYKFSSEVFVWGEHLWRKMDYTVQLYSSKAHFYNLFIYCDLFWECTFNFHKDCLKPLTEALLPLVLLCIATLRCGWSVWVARYAEMMWEVRRLGSGSVGNLQMF